MTRDEALAQAYETLLTAFILNTFAPLDEADHAVANAIQQADALCRLIDSGRL